jgi:hypothetical protein
MPNDQWRLLTAEAARKDNPIADRWLVRPDMDAHVLVIAERVPGGMVPIEAFADTVIANAKKTMKDYTATSREPWPAYPRNGRLIRGSGTGEGIELVYMYGLVTGYERAFQVVGFAPRKAPAEAMEDIAKIIDSLKLPPDMTFRPADVEKEPAGKAKGVSVAYTVDTPSAEWLRRTAEAVRKDNPIADVWLINPDMDAHVIIVAEHEPGAMIPIEAYTDAIIENAKKVSQDHQVVERKPWRAAPESGRFVHTTSTMQGQKFEHYYGFITLGDRAFQIIGFATSDNFRKAGSDMLGIIESFKLPADLTASPPGTNPNTNAKSPIGL